MKKIRIWLLIIVWSLGFAIWSLCYAMGGKPPAKEEPKYKVEILKMEIITTPSPETTTTGTLQPKAGKAKPVR